MATPAIIAITPGVGQLLDAVSLTVGLNTVVRETMVIADPSNATYLATVTSGGALNVADAVIEACITANVLAVSLPTAQIITLTPPSAAAIGTAVAGDLLIGTQVAGSSVPVALPTTTITTLTPPTASAIAAAIVSNPPAVLQGTSPWAVTGNLTHNNAAPTTNNVGVLSAVANVAHPTYTEGDQVLLSTDLTGAMRVSITGTVLASNNITEWNTTALGSPTAFGTGPSGNVIGVNAEMFQGASVVGSGNALYVQFPSAQAVTLTSTTITGTVSVTQGTTPWIVAGGGTAGSPGTAVLTVQGVGGGTAIPVSGTFYQATQPVSIASGQVASGAFASGSIASGAIASGAIASGAIAAGAAAAGAFADGSVYVRSNAAATFPVTASIAAAQTIAVTNAGTFAVQAVGTLTNNNAAPSTNNVGVLPAVSSAAAPTLTEGDQVLQSVDRKGRLRVHVGSTPFIIQQASGVSSGSVASLAVNFSSPVSVGTTLVVVCGYGTAVAPTVSDSQSNTYFNAVTQVHSPFGTSIFYAPSGTAGANTVTVTPSGSSSVAVQVYEISGVVNIGNGIAIDSYNGTQTTGTALTSHPVPLRYGEEIAFAAFAVGTTAETITLSNASAGTTTANWSNDSGQLNPASPSNLFSFISASTLASQSANFGANYGGIVFPTSSISANASIGASKPWASCIAVFRQPAQTVAGSVMMIGAGAGTANALATPLSVDGFGGIALSSAGDSPVAAADGLTNTVLPARDGNNNILDVSPYTRNYVYNGSTWDRVRTPNIFKTASVSATASGNTAVWTPTSGKKFRLMRFQIQGVNLVATAATVITVSFQDSSTGIAPGTYDVLLPASATATGVLMGGVQFNSDWVDLGNGYLSAAANQVLNCNISATVTGATGSFRVNVAGTEE